MYRRSSSVAAVISQLEELAGWQPIDEEGWYTSTAAYLPELLPIFQLPAASGMVTAIRPSTVPRAPA
jgi:hypothetical protein